jgi:hypothetical protein
MHLQRILLASTVLALSLVPVSVLAQAVDEPPATFNERYPAEPPVSQTPAQPPSSAQPSDTAQQKRPGAAGGHCGAVVAAASGSH